MKVVLDGGDVIDLGTTETTPTIGITDFSRRVTDDFGVTSVVKRGFARRMSVRLAVPFDGVDRLQQRLADLRATPARWIADDRLEWLSARGFYKDFTLDLATPPLSTCTLTIEGLAEAEAAADPGGDPAADGKASTLQLLQPVLIDDDALTASSVPETDAPEWAAGASYPLGARVIRSTAHRVYESASAVNIGNDPAASSGKWLDVGPTNRWAAFDQALGTVTTASGQIVSTLQPGDAVSGLAVLDTDAGSVRVQAPGYDRTRTRIDSGAGTSFLFLDLAVAPGAAVTVTIYAGGSSTTPRTWNDAAFWDDGAAWSDTNTSPGTGSVSVGTLLIGSLKALGVTEASPTAGITDYSRKEVDQFGEVTVVPRAWAKRMTAKALIRTDALDIVANRIATVRAQPSLWIGQDGLESLTVYGFFKDFSIEVGENVSKLSLSIEGLSKAAPVVPLGAGSSVAWPDIIDPTGTKPADNATNSADPTSPFGSGTVQDAIDAASARDAEIDQLQAEIDAAVDAAIDQANAGIATARGEAGAAKARADAAFVEIGSQVTRIDQRIDSVSASGDYDDAAVYAEVSRIDSASLGRDAALGESIQTVSASVQTTDTSLRALVETKEQAAVGREGAISQRIDNILVEGTGADGEDLIARAEIVRVDQASITRDGVLGQQISTVSASIGPAVNAKAQEITTAFTEANKALADRQTITEASSRADTRYLNGNATFSDWPDGQFLPSLFQSGEGDTSNHIARVPGKVGRWAMRQIYSAGYGAVNTYINASSLQFAYGQTDSRLAVGDGYFVIEADIELEDGQLVGSGLLVTAFSANGVPLQDEVFDFASEPDSANAINNAGVHGKRYRFSKLIRLTHPATAHLRFLPLLAFHAIDRDYSPYKTMIWHLAGIRAADDGEIRAGKAVGELIPALSAKVESHETALTDGRFATAQRATAIEAAAGEVAGRVGAVETATTDGRFATAERASAIEVAAGQLAGRVAATETATTDGRFASAQRAEEIAAYAGGLAGRVSNTETALTDGRFASAQRASTIEAAAGQLAARVASTETATTDGRFASAQRVDSVEVTANGASASASTTAQAVSDVKTGLAGARLALTAVSPTGVASVTIQSDNAFGNLIRLIGNVEINGNLTTSGTITARKFDRNSMSREGRTAWTGNVSPGPGQAVAVPFSLSLGQIPPVGRFIYEFFASFSTNAGTQQATTLNGKPAYTNFIADGGLSVSATDGQGHGYAARSNGSEPVLATVDFAPTWLASISRGNMDTGFINDGDYYYRNVSATNTVTGIDLKVTWVAI